MSGVVTEAGRGDDDTGKQLEKLNATRNSLIKCVSFYGIHVKKKFIFPLNFITFCIAMACGYCRGACCFYGLPQWHS